jgi:hypothetical protein
MPGKEIIRLLGVKGACLSEEFACVTDMNQQY